MVCQLLVVFELLLVFDLLFNSGNLLLNISLHPAVFNVVLSLAHRDQVPYHRTVDVIASKTQISGVFGGLYVALLIVALQLKLRGWMGISDFEGGDR